MKFPVTWYPAFFLHRDVRQIIINKVPHRVKQLTSLRLGDTICQVGGVLDGAKLQGFYVGF